MRGPSSLNMRCIFIKVTYSESGNHILQHGSEFFDFHNISSQIELADPATVQHRRSGLQQLLTACEPTWEEIMEKYRRVRAGVYYVKRT